MGIKKTVHIENAADRINRTELQINIRVRTADEAKALITTIVEQMCEVWDSGKQEVFIEMVIDALKEKIPILPVEGGVRRVPVEPEFREISMPPGPPINDAEARVMVVVDRLGPMMTEFDATMKRVNLVLDLAGVPEYKNSKFEPIEISDENDPYMAICVAKFFKALTQMHDADQMLSMCPNCFHKQVAPERDVEYRVICENCGQAILITARDDAPEPEEDVEPPAETTSDMSGFPYAEGSCPSPDPSGVPKPKGIDKLLEAPHVPNKVEKMEGPR
jgi:ribosomal protein S27E